MPGVMQDVSGNWKWDEASPVPLISCTPVGFKPAERDLNRSTWQVVAIHTYLGMHIVKRQSTLMDCTLSGLHGREQIIARDHLLAYRSTSSTLERASDCISRPRLRGLGLYPWPRQYVPQS